MKIDNGAMAALVLQSHRMKTFKKLSAILDFAVSSICNSNLLLKAIEDKFSHLYFLGNIRRYYKLPSQ